MTQLLEIHFLLKLQSVEILEVLLSSVSFLSVLLVLPFMVKLLQLSWQLDWQSRWAYSTVFWNVIRI